MKSAKRMFWYLVGVTLTALILALADRWNAFSFAIMDFYGYDDAPSLRLFNSFERKVDVRTGRPLDSLGRPLTPDNALAFTSGNRQAFDFGCLCRKGEGGDCGCGQRRAHEFRYGHFVLLLGPVPGFLGFESNLFTIMFRWFLPSHGRFPRHINGNGQWLGTCTLE